VSRGHHERRHVTTTVAPSGESASHRHRHQHAAVDQRRRGGGGGRTSSFYRGVVDVEHGLLSTRDMFARLPDLLCRSEQLRAGRDEPCWNGSAVSS